MIVHVVGHVTCDLLSGYITYGIIVYLIFIYKKNIHFIFVVIDGRIRATDRIGIIDDMPLKL